MLGKARKWLITLLVKMISRLERESASSGDIYYCYRLILDREPDPPGWQTWSKQSAAGMSKHDLANIFLNCQEFRDRQNAARNARVEMENFSMYVDANDQYIGQRILTDRDYEPAVTSIIRKLLKEEYTFLDIGANMGWFTLLTSVHLPHGKVIAVEPNPRNLQLLYQNIAVNHLENITVLPYAAAEKQQILRLVSSVSNAYVLPLEGDAALSEEYVPAVKLDDVLGDEPRIDMLKIDVEGYELLALMGMRGLLEKHHPVIISEFHPKVMVTEPEAYLSLFAELGYNISIIEDDGNVRHCDNNGEVIEYWKMLNRRLGTVDDAHLDILAE